MEDLKSYYPHSCYSFIQILSAQEGAEEHRIFHSFVMKLHPYASNYETILPSPLIFYFLLSLGNISTIAVTTDSCPSVRVSSLSPC